MESTWAPAPGAVRRIPRWAVAVMALGALLAAGLGFLIVLVWSATVVPPPPEQNNPAPAQIIVVQPPQEAPKPTFHTITYRVMSQEPRAMVLFQNVAGETERIDNVPLPWERTIRMPADKFRWLSVSGMLPFKLRQRYTPEITATIVVDGKTVAKDSGRPLCSASYMLDFAKILEKAADNAE